MIRTTCRLSRTDHRCGCGARIRAGERYLEHIMTPDHDGLGTQGWERFAECALCATRYGRDTLFTSDPS